MAYHFDYAISIN